MGSAIDGDRATRCCGQFQRLGQAEIFTQRIGQRPAAKGVAGAGHVDDGNRVSPNLDTAFPVERFGASGSQRADDPCRLLTSRASRH